MHTKEAIHLTNVMPALACRIKGKPILPTPADLTLVEIQCRFSTDEKARQYLEKIRWPRGVVCPHCRNRVEKRIWQIKANAGKNIRAGLYHCAKCGKQFTVTVGTMFEDSHIPLRKWLVAWYLLCSSDKAISALEFQRLLELGSYRTALFMMHRIRNAFGHAAFTGTISRSAKGSKATSYASRSYATRQTTKPPVAR
jgi:transposase-like protein